MSVLRSCKVMLAVICWMLSLPLLLTGTTAPLFSDVVLCLFVMIILLSVAGLRRQSVIILCALALIGYLVLPQMPSFAQLREAGAFMLIFACLLPTLTLVRATALTMPSVLETQTRLEQLPPKTSASGLQLASHVLGGVMNIGAFALIAASLPAGADLERRRVAAEAALRGMNGAVVWSPFLSALLWGGFICRRGLRSGRLYWVL